MPQKTLKPAELKILLLLKAGFELIEYFRNGTSAGIYVEKVTGFKNHIPIKARKHVLRAFVSGLAADGFLQTDNAPIDAIDFKSDVRKYRLTEKAKILIDA